MELCVPNLMDTSVLSSTPDPEKYVIETNIDTKRDTWLSQL